ncbi:hypothetical protein Atc_1120 [Acidithiobacillus caldus SM-1]|uniref:Uncharacterized protein n=1 Tax=Acidithiobacillus caldus (strain SM-1) TaxID=990288 RepID=F9ZLL8_ACICS|nr:hypothetical protein Atc_1120 [Acidithiobacillus caldus SM-1]
MHLLGIDGYNLRHLQSTNSVPVGRMANAAKAIPRLGVLEIQKPVVRVALRAEHVSLVT